MTSANPWTAYWETLGEGRLLFPPEAEEFARNFRAAVPLSPAAKLLDFGCGYGHVAALLAPHAGGVVYWDAAESMRRVAARTLAGVPNAREWDEREGGFDVVVVNSVAQYMTTDELGGWLRRWRELLAPGGRVVLADLIPPGHGSLSDMWSLFRFSVRRGYFYRAVRNTLAERRRYAAAAAVRPLTRVGRADLTRLAAAAGLRADTLPRNLSHFRGRVTAALTPTA